MLFELPLKSFYCYALILSSSYDCQLNYTHFKLNSQKPYRQKHQDAMITKLIFLHCHLTQCPKKKQIEKKEY